MRAPFSSAPKTQKAILSHLLSRKIDSYYFVHYKVFGHSYDNVYLALLWRLFTFWKCVLPFSTSSQLLVVVRKKNDSGPAPV